MARLLSVNVGLPRDIEWKGRTVHTGIWKNPVRGRCRVGRLNLEGDGQGDLAGHGGEHRAVLVYQLDSYRHWQERLKRDEFVYGQFGVFRWSVGVGVGWPLESPYLVYFAIRARPSSLDAVPST